MQNFTELNSRRVVMQTENSYARIKEIACLKKKLEIRRVLKQDHEVCYKFFSTFDYCMNLLKKNFREILENSYFDVDYKFWWIDKYCQSSYYRMRAKAVNAFVSLFNIIYENFPHFARNIVRSLR